MSQWAQFARRKKGRMENAVGYIKKNLLAGRELGELAALNAAARLWLDTVANVRLHGATRRTPLDLLAEERAHLRPLPAAPYAAALVRTVRVTNRCRVTVDTNRYSVPARYASTPLTLQLASERLRLFDGDCLVAEHVRSFDRHRDYEQPDHVQALLDERRQARHQRNFLRFLALSPMARRITPSSPSGA
ncbi:MAG: Mu transposase domain-containing protein [Opitutaceae bacterium]